MAVNPDPIDQRFEQWIARAERRLKRLEARCQVLEGPNVVAYTGTIPGSYTSGDPTVLLPTGVTLGPLPHLSSYTPHAGDTVYLAPLGGSYVVMGTYS
jgi:hypothetical protein